MKQTKILKGWLSIYVIINVIYFLYLWVNYLFVNQQSSEQSIEMSLSMIVCITNVVGIVYLSRNLRFGAYILFLIPIIILLVQFSLFKKIFLPIIVIIALSIITQLLLFIKSNKITIWSQMKKGLDLVHFKHIYQLAVMFLFMTIACGIYNYITIKDRERIEHLHDDKLLNESDTEELLQKLDKAEITLGEISKIEKILKEIPPKYDARIMALKHLLAGHVVPNIHDIKSFRMAYFLRRDAMSKEQQEILDWFFKQDNEVFKIWEITDGCDNLASFHKCIKEIIKNRKITEF